MKYAMMMGNPADGFVVIGPFTTREDAIQYMSTEKSGENCWIVELHEPAKPCISWRNLRT